MVVLNSVCVGVVALHCQAALCQPGGNLDVLLVWLMAFDLLPPPSQVSVRLLLTLLECCLWACVPWLAQPALL